MTINRSFVGLVGAILATACTATVHNHPLDDEDGGSGGSQASTGGQTGTGGRTGTGGAPGGTSGGGSGGGNTGGTPAGGSGGTDAGSGGSPADASPEADARGPDATPEAAAPDGSACSSGTNACEQCLEAKCCAEFNACDEACGGNGTSPGDLIAFHACMQAAFAADGGVGSIAACARVANDSGALSPTTQALVACITATTGDAGAQNCSQICYGGNAAP
jgi:hypothetical protein